MFPAVDYIKAATERMAGLGTSSVQKKSDNLCTTKSLV
jgi:hypothetical protein